MAQDVYCDFCESEPASILVTVIGTGDVTAVGPGCLPTFGKQLASVEAPVDAPPADEPAPDSPAVEEVSDTSSPPPGPSPKSAGRKPAQVPPAASEEQEAAPAATDG